MISPSNINPVRSRRIKSATLIFILAVSFAFSYVDENSRQRNQMISDARKIDRVVSENLDYVTTLGSFFGRKIVDNNKLEDMKYIDNLFKDTMRLEGSVDSVLSWAMFSWGDKSNKLRVTTLTGISPNPENLGDRSYIWSARYDAWNLKLSHADYGLVSKNLVIPAGIGISDKHDNYVGTIVAGINLKKLVNKIETVVQSDTSFIVADRDLSNGDRRGQIIFSSSNTPQVVDDSSKMLSVIEKCADWKAQSGTLESKIRAGRFKYVYYRAVDHYPLIIFIGFNQIEFWENVIALAAKISLLWIAAILLFKEARKRENH